MKPSVVRAATKREGVKRDARPNDTQDTDNHGVICDQGFRCLHMAESCDGQPDPGIRKEVRLGRPSVTAVVGRLTGNVANTVIGFNPYLLRYSSRYGQVATD